MKKSRKQHAHQKRHSARKIFIVQENETIDDCLDRMKKEGYDPIMRSQRPFFREGPEGPEVAGRHCVIEGRLRPAKGEQ
ncbi:NETI motif-containing protein [Sporolactobacillus sp. THM19-2]|uniref:NETI motif-containing protein n=1 Tax=Sporolactobacillus sp. THM19-2 TaxID=2511171 RepID=UPI0010211161|nr:NETI motif-containing protein [Sporolactobacillus sp. THM19-2]RYL90938.1 NETI motif-containing protein [Sporolactobacillus sp. THM19-2]